VCALDVCAGWVSLLRFSDDGLVLEERDFWNQG
jgi:hypothetical protein